MDPVSIFNALYDTKCLEFTGYKAIQSSTRSPYYMNLRRLSSCPRLMNAVVIQMVERFLTRPALAATASRLRRQSMEQASECRHNLGKLLKAANTHSGKSQESLDDIDSQLEDDMESTSSASDSEWDKCCDSLNPIICPVTRSAIPLASEAASQAKLPLLPYSTVENAKDSHSTIDQIEQPLDAADFDHENSGSVGGRKRQGVILIDVNCSGSDIIESIENLEQQNLKVQFVICLVDREEDGIQEVFDATGIRVLPLYTMSAILRVLETTGRISNEQFICTRRWIAKEENNFFSSCNPTNLMTKLIEQTNLDDPSKQVNEVTAVV